MNENLIPDIYQRLGGIEAKIDDVRAIRETADSANSTAQQALRLAESHEDKFADMQKEANANRRWLVGTIITTVLGAVGVVTTLISLY